MKAKIAWIDTETTGFDPLKHSIMQLSCIVDAGDGTELGEIDLRIRPFKGSLVSREALEKTGVTVADLRSDRYLDPLVAHAKFTEFLGRFVNPYDREEKLVIGGKRTEFDVNMLRRHFEKCGDRYYSSWFHYPIIDIEMVYAMLMVHHDLVMRNYKLESMCEIFGIKARFHDSMDDIRATKQLFYRMMEGDE